MQQHGQHRNERFHVPRLNPTAIREVAPGPALCAWPWRTRACAKLDDPLFRENRKERRDKGDRETREPEPVDPTDRRRDGGRREGRKWREECCGAGIQLGKDGECRNRRELCVVGLVVLISDELSVRARLAAKKLTTR